jgi:hypothetical protein
MVGSPHLVPGRISKPEISTSSNSCLKCTENGGSVSSNSAHPTRSSATRATLSPCDCKDVFSSHRCGARSIARLELSTVVLSEQLASKSRSWKENGGLVATGRCTLKKRHRPCLDLATCTKTKGGLAVIARRGDRYELSAAHWRSRPLVDAGDEANDFVARRIARGDCASLPSAGFDKARSTDVGNPYLHRAKSSCPHPLAIVRHALGRNRARRAWH